MFELESSNNNKNIRLIDPVQIQNQFAVYSTIKKDVIFSRTNFNDPIFSGGIVKDFERNVNNINKNEFVGYLSHKQDLDIKISSNLIFKLSDRENLKLIAIIPYASYAMKILRIINPKLGQNIVVLGLNFFSGLIARLLKLAGANIFIIKLEEDSNNHQEIINNEYIYGLNKAINELKHSEIDFIISFEEISKEIDEFFSNIVIKFKITLNQLSIYDKGLRDPNYIGGIKYPLPYVRWDYKRNLEYFIRLVERNILEIDFINFLMIKVKSLEELNEKKKNVREEEVLILFYIQN